MDTLAELTQGRDLEFPAQAVAQCAANDAHSPSILKINSTPDTVINCQATTATRTYTAVAASL